MPRLVFEEEALRNPSRYPLPRDPDFLDHVSNKQCVEDYRLEKYQLLYLERLLHDDLRPKRDTHGALTPLEIILTACSYFATGSIQKVDETF